MELCRSGHPSGILRSGSMLWLGEVEEGCNIWFFGSEYLLLPLEGHTHVVCAFEVPCIAHVDSFEKCRRSIQCTLLSGS
eukprot:jgi/Botrbrau1/13276/Bobra.0074s0023.1